jgi:hypothetical protein
MRAAILRLLSPALFVRDWVIALTGMLLWEAADRRLERDMRKMRGRQ